MLTRIRPESVHVCKTDDLPAAWAAELGRMIASGLSPTDCQLLQERSVGLGHGVLLAHLRTHHVSRPTLGAWKASDPSDDGQPWLWLVVLVPSGDPSRHLGWMAHLAAGLHDQELRERLRAADGRDAVVEMLQEVVSDRTPAHPIRAIPAAESPAPSAVKHHLVVAILKEVEFVDHLLALFVEHDVRGATVLEARGMAEHLAAHMSLFAGFKSAFKAVGHSQVILTVVPAERSNEVLGLVREAAGGMRTPGSGIAFVVEAPAVMGLGKREE